MTSFEDIPDDVIRYISENFLSADDNNNFRLSSSLLFNLIKRKIKANISDKNRIKFNLGEEIKVCKGTDSYINLTVFRDVLYVQNHLIDINFKYEDLLNNKLQLYEYDKGRIYDKSLLVFYKNKLMIFDSFNKFGRETMRKFPGLVGNPINKHKNLDCDINQINISFSRSYTGKKEFIDFYEEYIFSSEIILFVENLLIMTETFAYPIKLLFSDYNAQMKYERSYKNIKIYTSDTSNYTFYRYIIIVHQDGEKIIPLFYCKTELLADFLGNIKVSKDPEIEEKEIDIQFVNDKANIYDNITIDYLNIIYNKKSLLDLSDQIEKNLKK